ncbi:SpoIIE family protein phosphatase [Rhizobium sp. RU36D]|uniref:SpoIIE family protein phosphatase n=1 Tax=Rhizobium sp. RU36D TaxID=1907415 RepID=UPI0009D79C7B|nr:SpoIIE family protein phosphatase [Rhizobium sp. RU36D]SMC87511.1 sigma-B regulation protein RsbU (phosphoserine phosphatase) [Rhizobium sp. RU36D]
MTDAISQQQTAKVGRWSARSFRAKFILVVGAAVLFDLLLSGGIAIWNVQHLSRDAANQVGEGLTEANQEYLKTYIEATALRADLLLDRVHSDVTTLANTMQTLIDNPDVENAVGRAFESSPAFTTPLAYDTKGGWAQNQAGAPSAVSVWGYLLDQDKRPVPAAEQEVRNSAILSLIGPALMNTGAPKLQMYYVGPKDASIMRATPYSEQAQTFDKLYPGHNGGPNFWDFFFPGVYEGWQSWIANPASRPVASQIVTTAPYIDAITGKLIVSFFHPLWTQDRKDVAGMAAVDVTLDQLADLVESVAIAETGFGFLAMSNGNVIATNEIGTKTLGLKSSDQSGQGVTGVDRSLRNSTQPSIAALALPSDEHTQLLHVMLNRDGVEVPHLVVLKQLRPGNLWDGKTIVKDTMTLGFVVSEQEIYGSLMAAQEGISNATSRIVNYQIIAVLVSLAIVFVAVFAVSGRITAGLSALAEAARRLQNKDYSVRVNVPTRDEVGEVGVAFNRMAEEISYHTENLERLVDERTRALEQANHEITTLNERLKNENLRLGAELDVARQIQSMVLPKVAELDGIAEVEIAGFMQPADEVGGDYYDVLQDGGRIKVGIGDVTGHGLESGVLMLMVQSVARALQEKGGGDAKDFLEVLNRAIYKNIARTESDKHLTLAFLDYEDQKVTLTGQHEEVLVVRKTGKVERIDTGNLGFPIGLEGDISPFVDSMEIDFDTGDIIILYTDGVTEAESPEGELFGLDRLCDSAEAYRGGSAEVIVKGIISDLMAHIGTQKVHDDITLVVMRHR